MTWAVFMDRCNTSWREADGFATENEALRRVAGAARHAMHYWRDHGMVGHAPDASGFIDPEMAIVNEFDRALAALPAKPTPPKPD